MECIGDSRKRRKIHIDGERADSSERAKNQDHQGPVVCGRRHRKSSVLNLLDRRNAKNLRVKHQVLSARCRVQAGNTWKCVCSTCAQCSRGKALVKKQNLGAKGIGSESVEWQKGLSKASQEPINGCPVCRVVGKPLVAKKFSHTKHHPRSQQRRLRLSARSDKPNLVSDHEP
jgi:hypothetical protein